MRNPLLSLFIGIASLGAQTFDCSGVWLATDVPYAPWTVRLKQDGTKLTGTMEQHGGLQGMVNIYEGAINGSTVSFKANSPDGARVITFNGKIDGNEILLNRSTRIVTNESQGGNGLFGTKAAPQFTIVRSVVADCSAPNRFSFKGMDIDVLTIQCAPNREEILEGLRRQIDSVDEMVIAQDQKAFFKSVPLIMDAFPDATGDMAHYALSAKSVVLQSQFYNPQYPLLLHELLHAYHDQRLPKGYENADVQNLYKQAKMGGNFPANSYMLKNAVEYFAMMASVYLHGSITREPFTRQAIQEKQPDCYRWLVKQFGPR